MQLGKYQLVRKLATGGMAEVYLAKAAGPMGFEKTLVLKRILPHLAEDPAFVEMFLGEAKLVAQLEHPNIVQIFDFGEAQGSFFLAMELIDGPNLRKLVKHAQVEPLSPVLCAKVVSCAAEGLAYAHDFRDPVTGELLGLIHRDVSPDNILVSRQGAVKVVDFGIAKVAGQSHRTQTGVVKGKVAYMPPEQLETAPLDRRVDVYALGMVLYELLTGKRPFDATTEERVMRAILFEPLIPAVQRRPDLPVALQQVLDRALAKNRDKRYPDCRAMQADLERFIISTGEPVGPYQIAQFVGQWMAEAGGAPLGMTPPAVPPRAQVGTEPKPATGQKSMEAPADAPVDSLAPTAPTTALSLSMPSAERALLPTAPVEGAPERATVKERAVEPRANRPTVQERAVPPPFRGEGGELSTRPMRGLSVAGRHDTGAPWMLPPPVVMPPVMPIPFEAAAPAPEKGGTMVDAEDEVHTRSAEVTAPRDSKRRSSLIAVAVGGLFFAAGGGVLLFGTKAGKNAPLAAPPPVAPLAVVGGPADAGEPPVETGVTKTAVQEGVAQTQPTQSPPEENVPASPPAPAETASDAPVPAPTTRAKKKPSPSPLQQPRSASRPLPVTTKGKLEVRIRPFATVYLDGKLIGTTPLEPIEVPSGSHTLRLVNSRHGMDVTKTVEIKAHEHKLFKLNLLEEQGSGGTSSPE